MVDQHLATEKSGFGGIITEQNLYNTKNQLVKSMQTGRAATLYEYDSLGRVTCSGLDVDGDGVLTPDSNDRITERDGSIDGAWVIAVTKVYGTANSANTTVAETTKMRVNGWNGNLSAETQRPIFREVVSKRPRQRRPQGNDRRAVGCSEK